MPRLKVHIHRHEEIITGRTFGCAFRKMDAVVVLQQKVASIDASNGIKVLAQVRIGIHPILDESAIADFIELCNTVHT